jgi:hypothetical protein
MMLRQSCNAVAEVTARTRLVSQPRVLPVFVCSEPVMFVLLIGVEER